LDYGSSPADIGLSVGLSRTNTTVYVGRGLYAAQFIPSRYQVESPTGVYATYGAEQFIASSLAEYLIVPTGCNCYWLNPRVAIGMKGLVTVPDQNYPWAVGLKNISSTQVAIAKVLRSSLNQWWNTVNNAEVNDAATKLLVCQTTPPPPVQCALWQHYNKDSAPLTNGLFAGTHTSGQKIYVGRGMNFGGGHDDHDDP
jgi:hypothetical protein